MAEHLMLDELDDEMLDFDADVTNSDVEKVDSILIKKILNEMKCEFNRTNNNPKEGEDCEPRTGTNSSRSVEQRTKEPPDRDEEAAPPEASAPDDDPGSEEENETALAGSRPDEEENHPGREENEHSVEENDPHGDDNDPEAEGNEHNVEGNDLVAEEDDHGVEENEPGVEENEHNDDENEESVARSEETADELQPALEGNESPVEENEPEPEEQLESTQLDAVSTEQEPLTTAEDYTPDTCNDSQTIDSTIVYNEVKTNDDECESVVEGSNKPVDESNRASTESNSPGYVEPEDTPEVKKRRGSRASLQPEWDVSLKRSSRRMSKENSRESVLQSAIALKEKSFGSLQNDDKPQRRSTRLMDPDRSINIRLRNRASRYAVDHGDSYYIDRQSRPAPLDKMSRGSTEEDTEPDLKYNVVRPTSDDYQHKVPDSGSSESIHNDSLRKPRKKRKKPGPVPGSKRKKMLNESKKNSVISREWLNVQCECSQVTSLYVSRSSSAGSDGEEVMFCKGVDSVERRAVGCDNLADVSRPLVRPLPRVPFQSLCTVHLHRMLTHNCCPLCGVFCTRGIFMYCKYGHFYHKDCDLFYDNYTTCPHCGQTETKEITLTLAKTNNPFFLPTQKLFDKSVSARITVAPLSRLKPDREEEESDIGSTPSIVLPSGVEISVTGAPPLEREALKKCLSIFTSKNADMNCRYNNRNLFQAARTGDIEKMVQILWSGLSPNVCQKEGTPLHAAIRNGYMAMVHILVQGGASVDALDRDQYTPLMLACQLGYAHVVRYLIGAGAQRVFKGASGMTALHVAAKEGHLDCCFHLLANTSSPSGIVDALDEGHWTALVWAAENKQVEVVRFLIRKKANIHLRDTERNIAIHWAALAGSLEILDDLLNEGSDMNATNIYGDTPLHIAAREGSEECVMLLLSRGAIPDMVNKAAMVPRDCCRVPNPFIYDLITVSMKFTLVTANIPPFPRILTNDITRGKETNPVQCVNEVDDDDIPTDFTYVTENCFTTNVQVDNRITSLMPCKCDDNCTSCECACTLNSKGCWYDCNGKLNPDFNYEDPPLVFECNPACSCNTLSCVNRVVQKGIRVHLQMCKTKTKNWGVITLKDIPKGTYVCEYIGEIISDSEADTRQDDSYLFDLDNKEKESYCIDARWYGNITRFINHSCKPNLFPVRVYINHHDLRFPRIAFFAARDIPSHEELGFDYGEKFWMIKYKTFTCTCGADSCRYSDQTIQQTVLKYNESLKLEEQNASIS